MSTEDTGSAEAPTAPATDGPTEQPTEETSLQDIADAAAVTQAPEQQAPEPEAVDAPDAQPAADPPAEQPTLEQPAPEAPAGQPAAAEAAEPAVEAPAPQPVAPSPTALAAHRHPPGGAAGPAAAAVVAPTPPLAVGAATFGRVDETGTVHVRDGDTEREVGQYPDVPAEEALAFYVRKFEDLAAQVLLLGQRLDNGTVPAKEARQSLAALGEAATEAKAVGDLPALRTELERLGGLVEERARTEEAERTVARQAAIAERERIVVEAEQIAATPPERMHYKHAGERMAALLEEWKAAQRSGTRLDKKSEDPLWKRFAAARSTLDRLRRAHFAQVGEQRAATKADKGSIIARAEELQTSTDWRAASDEYRVLMDRWKAAGRLSRKDDDALWARFRAAQDVFFAARSEANAAQDEEYRGNLAVKEQLLAEAEALLPVKDIEQTRRRLASIQDRWDEAGRVSRRDLERIEGRLRAVIEKIRDADSARWGKSSSEVVARGSGMVSQLEAQIAELDVKVSEAEARGDSRAAARAAKERDTKRAWLEQARSSLSDLSR